jgi:hypothetical protein
MADPTSIPPALCLQWLSKEACTILDVIGTGLNSSFSTALLGSLAGAFAGAIAAQRIVESNKAREELLKELRNTNAATMAAFTTCNAGLALKNQHVQPLHTQFLADKADFDEFKTRQASGQTQGNTTHHFVSDMRTFPAPVVPIDTLKDLLFNKISVGGRPLSLICAIENASRGLKEAISARHALIERIKSGYILKDEIPAFYFGFPLPNGDTNQEYPDLVFAIHSYCDDLAFFSHLLCGDLTSHSKDLYSKLTKEQQKIAPKPTEADFTTSRESGLLPPDSQYTDWLRAFTKPGTTPPTEKYSK